MIDFNIYNVNVHRDELTLGWSLDLKVKFFQMGQEERKASFLVTRV